MKKIIAIFALVCVAAAAGCSNGNSASTTTAETTAAAAESDNTEKDDTQWLEMSGEESMAEATDKALEYLDEKAPLFGKYIRKRRNVPLSLENEIKMSDGTWKTGLYVKDEYTCAQVSENPDGSVTKVIYKDGKGYQVDSAKKSVYVQDDISLAEIKVITDSICMKNLSYDEISSSSYETDTAEYEGVEYDRIVITEPASGASAAHYFDKATGDEVYMISGDVVSKIVTFENTLADESVFDIPSDYTVKTFNDLTEEYKAEHPEG